jgi:hypothetical protein
MSKETFPHLEALRDEMRRLNGQASVSFSKGDA